MAQSKKDPDAVAPPGLFLIEPFPRPQGMIQLWPASGVYIKPTDVCIEPTSPGVHTGMTARSEKTPRRSLKVKVSPSSGRESKTGAGPTIRPARQQIVCSTWRALNFSLD